MKILNLGSFIIASFLLCSFQLNAKDIGTVVMVKGDVTMLLPGDREARKVVKNAVIREDTSIVTKEKSFARIRLNDKSVLMIGPKSKTVVEEMKKGDKGVVSLLTGKLRASVERSKVAKGENKLFVKTRTAAMGVRGTEFQTTYNHENKLTSLVTFKGEVAMAKVKESAPPVASTSKSKAAPVDQIKALDKILKEKKEVVLVKKGRYAGVSTNLQKATAPVKISPKQFTLLKLNENMQKEAPKISKEKLDKEIKETEKEFAKLTDNGNGVKKEGTFDAKTGSYHPKSGGLVDLETGVYIPPPKDSKFDEKTKVFVATKEIGDIDESGNYEPPKGLILDAKKGFIVEDEDKVEVKVSKLNQNIAGQIVKPQIPSKSDLDYIEEDAYEKYFDVE